MAGMAQWVETIPAFVVLEVVLFLPGWVVVRALGARGLEALAVSPAVSTGLIAVFATLAQRAGVRWGLLERHRPDDEGHRVELGVRHGQPRARPDQDQRRQLGDQRGAATEA